MIWKYLSGVRLKFKRTKNASWQIVDHRRGSKNIWSEFKLTFQSNRMLPNVAEFHWMPCEAQKKIASEKLHSWPVRGHKLNYCFLIWLVRRQRQAKFGETYLIPRGSGSYEKITAIRKSQGNFQIKRKRSFTLLVYEERRRGEIPRRLVCGLSSRVDAGIEDRRSTWNPWFLRPIFELLALFSRKVCQKIIFKTLESKNGNGLPLTAVWVVRFRHF